MSTTTEPAALDPNGDTGHSYAYDPLSRLQSDTRTSESTSWNYTAANELQQVVDPSGTGNLTYDASRQLQSLVTQNPSNVTTHSWGYGFNANGDRTSQSDAITGSSASFGYDQESRLTSYQTGSTTASYGYDGDGLRASKTVNGSAHNQVWDRSGSLPLLLDDGSNQYVYGPGGLPLEQVTGSSVLFFLQDQLGSTRGMTDSSGSIAGTYTYGAYGQTVLHTGGATPLQYAGQYTDAESGLQYLRARCYDPSTAQFLTVDPALMLTGDPYGYAAKCSARWRDT